MTGNERDTTMTTEDAVLQVLDTWAAAETAGDAEALAGLAVEDFVLCGPAGFVLDRDQWVARYRTGPLRTRSLELSGVTVRDYGGTAVSVGVQTQEASFGEHDASGRFRVTHILVADHGTWRLAGQHLSPIVGGAA